MVIQISFEVKKEEKAFLWQVARAKHVTLSAFCRNAALERALGQVPDNSTSDIIHEIAELRLLVVERSQAKREVQATLQAAAASEDPLPELEIRSKITGILAQSPPLNLYDISRATGFPEKFILVTISRMIDQHVVEVDERTLEYKLVK
jgi:uncharacterized protein (DUF1778 family)